ncbi:MAG: hypothetical protein AAGD11_12710 [Planctomycetota bacterium]
MATSRLTTKICALSAVVLLHAAVANAYVVIESIDIGDADMDASATGLASDGEKATGDVDDVQSGELSGALGFRAPSKRSSDGRGNSKERRGAGSLSRYPRANVQSGGGGAGGGGGGGGRARGQGQRGRGNRDIVQTVVVADEETVDESYGNDDGTDLTVYDSGTSGDAGSSGTGGGGGSAGGGGAGDEFVDYGPGVTGTPEPTALAVWAIAGCCGYGAIRFRNLRRGA